MNEVMPNPWPSYDNDTYPGGEWIEILNTGQTDFDVSQIYLEDLAGNVINPNSSHLIPSSSSVEQTLLLEDMQSWLSTV